MAHAVAEAPTEKPLSTRKLEMVRDGTSVLAGQAAMLLAGVASNFLIARLLGPEGKGLIYLMQLIATVFGLVLLNFGLGPAAVFHLGRKSHSPAVIASGVFWCSLLLGSIPLLVYGLATLFQARLPLGLEPELLLQALIAIPALVIAFNVGYLCLGLGRIASYNALRMAPSIVFCGLLVTATIGFQPSVASVALLWLLSVAVPAGYALIVVLRTGGARLPWRSKFLGDAFRFGWRSHLGAVTQYLQFRVDVMLVALFLPLAEVGIYSLAIAIAETVWHVPHAIATVLMPRIANAAEHDYAHLTPPVCRATVAITAVLSIAVTAANTWIIPHVLPRFAAAAGILWLLVPGITVASIFKVLSSDFNGRGKPLKTLAPSLISVCAVGLAGLYLIPRFGLEAAALLASGGYLLNSALYVSRYARMTSVPVRSLVLLTRRDILNLGNALQRLRSEVA